MFRSRSLASVATPQPQHFQQDVHCKLRQRWQQYLATEHPHLNLLIESKDATAYESLLLNLDAPALRHRRLPAFTTRPPLRLDVPLSHRTPALWHQKALEAGVAYALAAVAFR